MNFSLLFTIWLQATPVLAALAAPAAATTALEDPSSPEDHFIAHEFEPADEQTDKADVTKSHRMFWALAIALVLFILFAMAQL